MSPSKSVIRAFWRLQPLVESKPANVSEPACSTCNDTGEVYTEAQFGGVPAKVDPCPDCCRPVVVLKAVNPWTCDLSELPPVSRLQEMQPEWWATTTVPPLGKGCVLCGDGLGLKTIVLDPLLPPERLCQRCRDYFRESLEAERARFPEAGSAQDFRVFGDDLVPAGLSDANPRLPA